MNSEMSRRVARAMGKARPAPTAAERNRILRAMEGVDRWDELPVDIRRLVADMEASAIGGMNG